MQENLQHIHLVSDSTGETVSSIMRSAMSQFDNVKIQEHMWSLVRTKGQMERVMEGIQSQPGMVLYTIIDPDLQQILREGCRKMRMPCVPVLADTIRELSRFLGQNIKAQVGRQYELDEEYFARVEAVNFTLAHDDGQATEDLEEADIVLVGVSRTSKTPTCVYLSYRGINAANVPYVKGCPLPENLFTLKNPFIVGLVIAPDRLLQIRKSRLLSLKETRETSYVEMDAIKEEVTEARRLFTKQGWPVIDVTRKSIEETTATILQLYTKYKESALNAEE